MVPELIFCALGLYWHIILTPKYAQGRRAERLIGTDRPAILLPPALREGLAQSSFPFDINIFRFLVVFFSRVVPLAGEVRHIGQKYGLHHSKVQMEFNLPITINICCQD